jgi:hypothetical protein
VRVYSTIDGDFALAVVCLASAEHRGAGRIEKTPPPAPGVGFSFQPKREPMSNLEADDNKCGLQWMKAA